jgi:transcriptional regulator with XRE-family HTH domain
VAKTTVTQRQLAKQFGLSPSMISEVLKGHKKLGESSCKRISEKTGIDWWIIKDATTNELWDILTSSKG